MQLAGLSAEIARRTTMAEIAEVPPTDRTDTLVERLSAATIDTL